MDEHPPHFTGLELMFAEILSAGFVAHVLHAIAHLPPFITGGISAVVVGVVLRVADPTLRAVGERVRKRVVPTTPPPPEKDADR